MAGAKQKVPLSDDVILDFGGLFSGETADRHQPEQAQPLFKKSQRELEDHQRSLEVYRAYQENTMKSEQIQAEILKGIRTGEDVRSLFLKAAEAIAIMTNNPAFFSQIEEDTQRIYGKAPAPALQ